MVTIFNIIIYVFVFMFGITIGSFLNVCILRLPKGESLTKQNSHCMTCGAQIKRYDLIPVFSWLILRGKCRSCGAPISPRYMIVESLTGVLFMIAYAVYPPESYGIYFVMLFLFIAGMEVLAFQDMDSQEMCVSVIIYSFIEAVLTIGLTFVKTDGNSLVRFPVTIRECVIGLFAVSVPLLVIGFLATPMIYSLCISQEHKDLRRLRKVLKSEKNEKARKKILSDIEKTEAVIKEEGPVYGFGMGDILVMAIGGLLLGYKAALVSLTIAIASGAVYALVKAALPSDESSSNKFAFGPFLILGLVISSFCGNILFDSYISTLTL